MTAPATKSDGPLVLLARVLLSLVGGVFFFASSALLFPVALVLWLATLPFDRNLVVQHLFTCWWATLYLWCHPGWRYRIEGRDKLPWNRAAVLVPNHQSLVDALVMFALFRPFKPVSKTVVQFVPFIGWNMMMNRYIRLARGERKSIAKMSKDCRYWLRRGMSVMIYPEGTRSPDGEIQQFKNGAFTLAVEENCPVYPIVIDGTTDALAKHGGLLGLRASIVAHVLDPVFPDSIEVAAADSRPRDRVSALRDRVRALMIEELARIRAEKRAVRGQAQT